jgi:hypothetical protein
LCSTPHLIFFALWTKSILIRAGTNLHSLVAPSLVRSFPYILFYTNCLLSLHIRSFNNASSPKFGTPCFLLSLRLFKPAMTEVMATQGFKLSAPPSRQDVISALLTEYGNSFGRGDASPSAFSPLPIDKELPSPPRSDSLANKPLPAVQRAEQRMSTKFQLRGKFVLYNLLHKLAKLRSVARSCASHPLTSRWERWLRPQKSHQPNLVFLYLSTLPSCSSSAFKNS